MRDFLLLVVFGVCFGICLAISQLIGFDMDADFRRRGA